jgi:hypothetical protein
MRIEVSKALLRPLVAVAGMVLATLVAPAVAKAPQLAMLDGLANGAWVLHYRESDERDKICVRTGRELIQIRHRAAKCSHYVVDDQPNLVTVQYTCPGVGYGRTTIRRETPRLVQIESSGIEGGLPFHVSAEGRRVGGC